MRVRVVTTIAAAVILVLAGAWFLLQRETRLKAHAAVPALPAAPPKPADILSTLQVERGETFSELLQKADIDSATAEQIIAAARPVMNFHRVRQGQQMFLVQSAVGKFVSLSYRPDAAEEVRITPGPDGFEAKKTEIPVTTEIVTVAGTVESSLFDAVMAAGEHPELAVRLADIFAWDLDFYTDTRPGDSFRLVVEKKKYQGTDEVEYGKIFAAEYNNAGHLYQAVLFHDPAGRPGYYAANGQSLQKAFLRSPLKFAARISSHFSLHRFHPILKIYRPHLGTDYAAPVGTPVQAVARGRVEFAGRLGGDGNMVRLRHSNGYETYYLHLSRILVHQGQSVRQGQLVGRVGETGLATGPHLDFRVRRAGRFINFERMKLPPAKPVVRADLPEFKLVRDKWLAQLSRTGTMLAQAPQAPAAHAGTP